MKTQSQIQFRKFDFSKKLDLGMDLLRNVESIVKGIVSKRDESIRWVFQPYVDLIDSMIEGAENPENLIFHNFTVSPELIHSMDLMSFSPEALSFFAPAEYVAAYRDCSLIEHVPEHMCSFLSTALGMAVSNVMPKPKGILYASHPCDNGVALGQALSEYYRVKAFIIDSPYDDNKKAHEYFAGQIKDLFRYLEEITGKRLNIDRLRESCKRSDKAHELLYQINELKKNKPCPLASSAILRAISIAMYMMVDTEDTIHWLERLLEDVKQRVDKGIGGKCEEKMRIAWIYTLPSFDPAIFEWMEEKFGATSVIFQGADSFYWPIYKPIRKHDYDYSFDELCLILANKSLNTPMARQSRGHLDRFVRDTIHWCKEWDIDAAIFSGHIQCKANWSAAQVAKEALMDELGVATLIHEIDCIDPRVVSAEQIVGKMEPFLEMVAENKGL